MSPEPRPAPSAPAPPAEFRYFQDRHGRQVFNFPQRIWLRPAVRMACTRAPSLALATLAVNLLAGALEGADRDRRARRLAPSFCRECLLTAPPEAWAMPRTTIAQWAAAHPAPGRPAAK